MQAAQESSPDRMRRRRGSARRSELTIPLVETPEIRDEGPRAGGRVAGCGRAVDSEREMTDRSPSSSSAEASKHALPSNAVHYLTPFQIVTAVPLGIRLACRLGI